MVIDNSKNYFGSSRDYTLTYIDKNKQTHIFTSGYVIDLVDAAQKLANDACNGRLEEYMNATPVVFVDHNALVNSGGKMVHYTMATDNEYIYINPMFVLKLYEYSNFTGYKYIAFVLVHECYHNVLCHRSRSDAGDYYKNPKRPYAIDYEVNIVIESIFGSFKKTTKKCNGLIDVQPDGSPFICKDGTEWTIDMPIEKHPLFGRMFEDFIDELPTPNDQNDQGQNGQQGQGGQPGQPGDGSNSNNNLQKDPEFLRGVKDGIAAARAKLIAQGKLKESEICTFFNSLLEDAGVVTKSSYDSGWNYGYNEYMRRFNAQEKNNQSSNSDSNELEMPGSGQSTDDQNGENDDQNDNSGNSTSDDNGDNSDNQDDNSGNSSSGSGNDFDFDDMTSNGTGSSHGSYYDFDAGYDINTSVISQEDGAKLRQQSGYDDANKKFGNGAEKSTGGSKFDPSNMADNIKKDIESNPQRGMKSPIGQAIAQAVEQKANELLKKGTPIRNWVEILDSYLVSGYSDQDDCLDRTEYVVSRRSNMEFHQERIYDQGNEIIIMLDVSGSMFSIPGTLDAVVEQVNDILYEMNTEYVRIMIFSGDVFPDGTPENMRYDMMERLPEKYQLPKEGGGTNIPAALKFVEENYSGNGKYAYEPIDAVIIFTDTATEEQYNEIKSTDFSWKDNTIWVAVNNARYTKPLRAPFGEIIEITEDELVKYINTSKLQIKENAVDKYSKKHRLFEGGLDDEDDDDIQNNDTYDGASLNASEPVVKCPDTEEDIPAIFNVDRYAGTRKLLSSKEAANEAGRLISIGLRGMGFCSDSANIEIKSHKDGIEINVDDLTIDRNQPISNIAEWPTSKYSDKQFSFTTSFNNYIGRSDRKKSFGTLLSFLNSVAKYVYHLVRYDGTVPTGNDSGSIRIFKFHKCGEFTISNYDLSMIPNWIPDECDNVYIDSCYGGNKELSIANIRIINVHNLFSINRLRNFSFSDDNIEQVCSMFPKAEKFEISNSGTISDPYYLESALNYYNKNKE